MYTAVDMLDQKSDQKKHFFETIVSAAQHAGDGFSGLPTL